jgi:hypothetical protein
MEYKDKLQKIYDTGKENQDKNLSAENAEEIMEFLNVDFGEFSDEIETALEGMTGIEAFLYLNELTSVLDKADGSLDGKIASNIDIKDAFADAGIGGNQREIEEKLLTAASEFKEDDDTTDAQKIAFLQSTQGDTQPDSSEVINDIAYFTWALGTTDLLGNVSENSSTTQTQPHESAKKIIEVLNTTLTGLMQMIRSIVPMMESFSQRNQSTNNNAQLMAMLNKVNAAERKATLQATSGLSEMINMMQNLKKQK